MDDGSQEARRQIWTLYHPSDLVEEEETNDAMIMDLGTITVEDNWSEEYELDDQSNGTLEELFFSAPDYEEIRLYEEPKVHKYWEAGLTMESLDALRLGRWDHTCSMCYHCKNQDHLKANCPERRCANR